MSDTAYTLPADFAERIRSWRRLFLMAGAGAGLLAGVGAFLDPDQFFRSYLWPYMFFIGITLGCMALLMLQYLTGGAWGMVIRRICEAATRTLPVLALLFIPIVIGIPRLYHWSHPEAVAADEVLRHKSIYLNTPFFLARAVFYFGGWMLLALLLNKGSASLDRTRSDADYRRLQHISGPGLVFWALTVTFMSLDWVLSLNPHWFSTMFGLLFMAGQGLSALAMLITVTAILAARRPFDNVITQAHLHDLGKLTLAFVMVWSYFSFSQFLIIWSGNLVEEIPWYLTRLHGGWQYVALLLVLFHFALPFALLLSRDIKRNVRLLRTIAGLILVMRFVDLFWLVAPDFHGGHFGVSWMDLVMPVAFGGIWLYFFAGEIVKRPLLPVGDPHLEEALAHGRE